MFAELLCIYLSAVAPTSAATPPTVPPSAVWKPIAPTGSQTKSGIRVLVTPRNDLPLVHLNIIVQAGSASDPVDAPGTAAALALALEEGGTVQHPGSEFSRAIDELGGKLMMQIQPSHTHFALTVLSSNLPRALDLLAEMVSTPALKADDWTRIQQQRISEIRRRNDEPQAIADDTLNAMVLNGTPYAHPPLGTVESVSKMTVQNLRTFWAAYYSPKTVSIFADGQVAAEPLVKLAESAFKHFSGNGQPAPTVAVKSAPARWVIVDRPGAPQTVIRIGHPSIAPNSRQFGAAQISDVILGGSFTSRLVQNLREKNGYTYGAFARHHWQINTSLSTLGSSVRSDVTIPALREMLREFNGMLAPWSQAEIDKARSLICNQLVDSLGSGMGSLLYSQLIGLRLPLDILNQIPGSLVGVSPEALREVQETLIRPNDLSVVLVGDKKLIESQLTKWPEAPRLELWKL